MDLSYFLISLLGLTLSLGLLMSASTTTKKAYPALRRTMLAFLGLQTMFSLLNTIRIALNVSNSTDGPKILWFLALVAFDWSYLAGYTLVRVIHESHVVLLRPRYRVFILVFGIAVIIMDYAFAYSSTEISPVWLIEQAYQYFFLIFILGKLIAIRKNLHDGVYRKKNTYLLVGFFLMLFLANFIFFLVTPDQFIFYFSVLVGVSMVINTGGLLLIFLAFHHETEESDEKSPKLSECDVKIPV